MTWKAYVLAQTVENHMRLLPPSCPARVNAPKEAPLPSKLRCAQELLLLFPFRFLLCWANLTPCLAAGVYFLHPALLQPSPSYLHPCRPQWMIHLERLPSSIRKLCNYTLQPSLGFSDLTVLCNAWKTLAFSYLFLFSTLSLALSLSYIQYWLFMLFNVVERARGLRMGEKRSSWHTYAPIVNSSSQHSSKYTDLLLFPLPPSSVSFAASLFLQLGACLIISTRVAPLQRSPYGRLRCSDAQAKYLHNNPLLHQSRGSGVERRDLWGVLGGAREHGSHLQAEKASVKPDREQKWPLHLWMRHLSSICQPTFRSTFDSYSLSHTLPIDGLKSLQRGCDEQWLPWVVLNTSMLT